MKAIYTHIPNKQKQNKIKLTIDLLVACSGPYISVIMMKHWVPTLVHTHRGRNFSRFSFTNSRGRFSCSHSVLFYQRRPTVWTWGSVGAGARVGAGGGAGPANRSLAPPRPPPPPQGREAATIDRSSNRLHFISDRSICINFFVSNFVAYSALFLLLLVRFRIVIFSYVNGLGLRC